MSKARTIILQDGLIIEKNTRFSLEVKLNVQASILAFMKEAVESLTPGS